MSIPSAQACLHGYEISVSKDGKPSYTAMKVKCYAIYNLAMSYKLQMIV